MLKVPMICAGARSEAGLTTPIYLRDIQRFKYYIDRVLLNNEVTLRGKIESVAKDTFSSKAVFLIFPMKNDFDRLSRKPKESDTDYNLRENAMTLVRICLEDLYPVGRQFSREIPPPASIIQINIADPEKEMLIKWIIPKDYKSFNEAEDNIEGEAETVQSAFQMGISPDCAIKSVIIAPIVTQQKFIHAVIVMVSDSREYISRDLAVAAALVNKFHKPIIEKAISCYQIPEH